MSIEAITPVAASPVSLDLAGASTHIGPQATGSDFASMIGQGLDRVDHSLRAADDKIRSLAAGEYVPLHEVMISMEQARMDLMLVVEVRNRLVEAYQELTRMQL